MAYNGGCSILKFVQDVCDIMKIDSGFTITYHTKTNGQVKQYNIKILATLLTYVADDPRDLDMYTDAFTYAYNCWPNTSTCVAPLEFVMSKSFVPLAVEPMPPTAETHGDVKLNN